MARKPTTGTRVLAGVLLLIAVGLGCKPLALPFYLFNMNKPKLPSHYGFYEKAREAKDKKEIKIAVLVERGRGLSPDFIGSERTLGNLIVNNFKAGFEKNKERVTVVPVADVDKFKREHEEWRAMEGYEIARKLGVDYVIDMEVVSMSLYEPGSRHLFRGQCVVSVRVIDSDKDAAELFAAHEYVKEFPGSGVTIAADSQTTPQQFQNQFLAKMAVDLTGLFTPLQTRARFD